MKKQRKMMKQLLSHILCMVLVMSGLVIPVKEVKAETLVSAEGYEYVVLENGTVEVKGYDGTEADLAIPGEIDGKTVTSVGESFSWNCPGWTVWTSIIIPDTVTHIGKEAFMGCTSLTKVTIPKGVTCIRQSLFDGCTKLESVTIPDGVTSIEDNAFFMCEKLKNVTIPERVTSIGDCAFQNCSSLESIMIPESVTHIGDYAFCACAGLTSVTISEGVTGIGELAFAACSKLQNVIIPDGVTSIGEAAFAECSGLKSVEIPSSITAMGADMFAECPEDMIIYAEENSFGKLYADNAGIQVKEAPVKEIAGATGEVLATYTYDGLKKVPTGKELKVWYLGDVLDENVDYRISEYKDNLYAGTGSVTLEGIGKYTGKLVVEFDISKAEKPANTPSESISVSYVNQTVGACVLPKDWEWDEKDASKALEIGTAVKATAYYAAPDKDSYEQTSVVITLTRSKCEHEWDAGVVETSATTENVGKMLYTCKVCKEKKSADIDKLPLPKKGEKRRDKDKKANYVVTKSGGKTVEVAFAGVSVNANKVVIPDEVVLSDGTRAKVTSIAKNALKGNKKVKSVTIGKNVKKIGSKAFYGCSKLKKLTIKSTKLTVKKIGSKAFAKTPKNMTVKAPKNKNQKYKAMLIKRGVNKKAKFRNM